MSENMNKVLELLKKNPELQEKVMAALNALAQDATLETMLNDVLAPVAMEAGVALTAEDVKDFADSMPEDTTLSLDDLTGVNGGLILGVVPAMGKAIRSIVTAVNSAKKTSKRGN